MSRENVKKFMELVKSEESLAKRMVALKDGLQEGEFAFKDDKEFVEKKILPLAKEYDLEFSVEDFMEFTSSQLTSLSEDELAEVSGGFPGIGLLIGLSVFLGGAATPTIASKAVSYFTGGGTSTSMVQSVSDKDVGNSVTVEADQTAESQQQRKLDKNFKNFVSQKKKELKTKLNDGTYLSPVARKDKINEIAKSLGGTTIDGQTITAVYNETTDDITFKSNKTSQTETVYDKIRTPLYNAQSTNLERQYNEVCVKAPQLVQQYNTLNQQLQQKQKDKAGYDSAIAVLQNTNTTLQKTVDYCYSKLIDVCDSLIQNNPYNNYQFVQWKEALQRKNFSSWDNLKTQAERYTTIENGQKYKCSGYVDTLVSNAQQLQNNNYQISQLQNSAKQAQTEIDSINTQMQKISNELLPYAANQQAFIANMKTEFDYFYGELVKALKEDEEITQLANSANTTEAKIALANKIKEKADQLVQEQFSKQLLDDCSLVVEHQDDSIGMKIVYGSYWFHQNSFSVDEFISAENHLEIINSEASKKRDEVAKKLAEYMQKQYTKITDDDELKRTIQSVLTDLKDGKLNELNLGMQIVNSDNKQVTFSSASGGQQRNTILTIERIADEYNKMVNMQAMEATRQKNEGTIEYTPFGRKLWNSIGSQAQHVLDTLNQISDLSDVKDRKAFENDLKYVANRILTQGNTPYGLKGDHRTDTSIKADDLQKIKDFAAKIGQ